MWHYQPDATRHRTACGREDNSTRPFDLTPDPEDVDCLRCKATTIYRQHTTEGN